MISICGKNTNIDIEKLNSKLECSEPVKINLLKSYCTSIYGIGLWCNYMHELNFQ